jgi:transcriptional regulator with XRE-family HTH domain
MARFGDKVMALISDIPLDKAKTARAIGVDASQFGKWIKGTAWPKPEQLLALARFLEVSCEYLVDDTMDAPESASPLSEDERYLLRVMRGLRLDFEESVRRLVGEVATKPAEAPRPTIGQPGSGGTVGVQDLPPRKASKPHLSDVGHPDDPITERTGDPVPRRRGK